MPIIADTPTQLLFYCRPGFEKECAAEITERANYHQIPGYIRTKPDSGWLLYVLHDAEQCLALYNALSWQELIFPRQMLAVAPLLTELPVGDRVTPILAQASALAASLGPRFGSVLLETADTNEAKELSAFCKKFEKPLTSALQKKGILVENPRFLRLHLFWLGSAAVYVGVSDPKNSSPWPLGIPRLRISRHAPSRSALKLGEAFVHFGLEPRLQAGQTGVDLGAAPGGWSWQLVQRGIHVTAIDNGPMDKGLLATEMVEHLKTDGFHYRPKRPVYWLVCDMVEKPQRIAKLMADWIAEGHAQEAIFNLKLPMKKRFEETLICRNLIEDRLLEADIPFSLAIRQLYHDREEVTCHLRNTRKRS